MAVNRNFTVKYDLDEANTVKAALTAYRDAMMARALEDPEGAESETSRMEAGRAQDILRRDF